MARSRRDEQAVVARYQLGQDADVTEERRAGRNAERKRESIL